LGQESGTFYNVYKTKWTAVGIAANNEHGIGQSVNNNNNNNNNRISIAPYGRNFRGAKTDGTIRRIILLRGQHLDE